MVWGLIASMYVGNFLLLLMNLFMIPAFVAMLRVPYSCLMGFIVIFASIGAFSVNNNLFDVWMMLGFGLLGYVMKKLDYPIVPLVLALVLGRLAENSLRQSLTISGGSFIYLLHAAFLLAFCYRGYSGLLLAVDPLGVKRPSACEGRYSTGLKRI